MKQIKLEATNKLEEFVKNWIIEKAAEYTDTSIEEVFKDLIHGGCVSGYVSELIYYADTAAFFKKFKEEINELLKEAIENCGSVEAVFGEKWDKTDPLALDDQNQNLLAWFGFEETARNLCTKAGLEG